ncbi:MAG: thymidine phosphorylase [Alteromonadaceae bacterium]|jgi:thymidine phosphorylase
MMILPQSIIRKKRDKHVLSKADIQAFVDGLSLSTFTDAQASSMAMAIYLNGMNTNEIVDLTTAMMNSGTVLDWKGKVDGPVVDKHSTGGVGDKVTLMLTPMVAACGGFVPSITGRGLGHTGGTVDKLESVKGLNMQPKLEDLTRLVSELGAAIISQTNELAPADRRLYSLRDVTATVESIPLITASILSKKLAEGLDALVMDVKVGSGAMMDNIEDARALARSIVAVGNGAGMKTEALITDMNEVLGHTAGNALEIVETLDYLSGKQREARLHEVVMALGVRMLLVTGLAENETVAQENLQEALDSGKAADIFAKMIVAQGGPADLFDNPDKYLAKAKIIIPIEAPISGYLSKVDVRAVGNMIVGIGGGRVDHNSSVNPAVGLTNVLPLGSYVEKGQPMAMLHIDEQSKAKDAINEFITAVVIGDQKPELNNVVLELIT